MKAVKTGITGLDELFSIGGYPRGSSILLVGGPGSGKSILGMQYLYYGATEYGEPGIFFTLDEPPEKIKRNTKSFGWELESLEKEGKLLIMDAVSYMLKDQVDLESLREGMDVDNFIANFREAVEATNAKRIVLDSLAVMNLYAQDDFEKRRKLLKLSYQLTRQDVTSLIITEARSSDIGFHEFPPESYMFDGLITLRLEPENQLRKISIRKMRGTKHVVGNFKFKITSSGIEFSA